MHDLSILHFFFFEAVVITKYTNSRDGMDAEPACPTLVYGTGAPLQVARAAGYRALRRVRACCLKQNCPDCSLLSCRRAFPETFGAAQGLKWGAGAFSHPSWLSNDRRKLFLEHTFVFLRPAFHHVFNLVGIYGFREGKLNLRTRL